MEKEMKKLLLVAVSVGVFLLVTITVAIIVLTPRVQARETNFSTSVPYSHGRVQPVTEIIPVQPAAVVDTQPVDIVSEIPEIVSIADLRNEEGLTIQIPRPNSAAIPEPAAAVRQQAPVAPAAAVTPVAASPAARQQTPAAAKPAQTAATNQRPAATAAAPRTRTVNDFWIQTGAFSSMVRAEDAKENLSSKGLTSIIETRIINGQTLYRVRLGPYTSENEAKHWLDIVKLIDGFNESQVRQTTRQM